MKKLLVFFGCFIPFISWCQPNSYDNIVSFYDANLANGIKIKTQLPLSGNHMATVRVEGYNNGQPIAMGLTIGWKVYGGNFSNTSVSSFGGIAPIVKLSVVDGLIQIHIATWGEPSLKVSAMDGGLGETSSWFSGWTVADEAYSAGTTNITPYYINRFGGTTEFADLSAVNGYITNLNAGKVGVGTSSPTYKLDVIGASTDSYIRIASGSNSTKAGFLIQGNNSSTSNLWGIVAQENSGDLSIGSGSMTSILRLSQSGNVSIGSSTFSSVLSVKSGTPIFTINGTTGDALRGIIYQNSGTDSKISISICTHTAKCPGNGLHFQVHAFKGSIPAWQVGMHLKDQLPPAVEYPEIIHLFNAE